MAVDQPARASGPPSTYRSDDVNVRLVHQPGAARVPVIRVTLSGSGAGTFERGDQTRPIRYAAKAMLDLLNELYRIRFFELPASYRARQSVFLRPDGTIGTQALAPSDQSSTTVCVTIATYEKCVTYGSGGPRELEEIVQRVFAEAERLVDTTAK